MNNSFPFPSKIKTWQSLRILHAIHLIVTSSLLSLSIRTPSHRNIVPLWTSYYNILSSFYDYTTYDKLFAWWFFFFLYIPKIRRPASIRHKGVTSWQIFAILVFSWTLNPLRTLSGPLRIMIWTNLIYYTCMRKLIS